MPAPALIFLRSVAMVACALLLTVAFYALLNLVLPTRATLAETFGRLGWAMITGIPAGAVLGAVLTHRLGRASFDAGTRMGHAVAAAFLALLMAGGWLALNG